MNNTPKSSLAGTRTEANLKDAAANEALAHIKYTFFERLAKDEGNLEAQRLFNELAGHEKEHAELWLSYLDELSDTEDNLDRAIRGETYEASEYYPEYSRIAAEEGFTEIADKFRMTGSVEARHAEMFNSLLKEMHRVPNDTDAETIWKCTNCGFHSKGNLPPERCPLCSYPKWYFTKA